MLKVIEDSERFIHQIGFPGTRVRKHGEIVRIESPPHLLDKIFEIENRTRIVEYLKSLGIEYVTIDLEGYRTGSMNIID
jgi:uncharacterized protein